MTEEEIRVLVHVLRTLSVCVDVVPPNEQWKVAVVRRENPGLFSEEDSTEEPEEPL